MPITYTVDMPAPFQGTSEEREANLATHYFGGIDGRCWDCDCRPSGTAASYPCGAKVPRETRTITR